MIIVLMKEETTATNTDRPSTTRVKSRPMPMCWTNTCVAPVQAVGISAIAEIAVAAPRITAQALRRRRDSMPTSGTVKLPRTGIPITIRTRSSQVICKASLRREKWSRLFQGGKP